VFSVLKSCYVLVQEYFPENMLGVYIEIGQC
jgi:hypothetical protein